MILEPGLKFPPTQEVEFLLLILGPENGSGLDSDPWEFLIQLLNPEFLNERTTRLEPKPTNPEPTTRFDPKPTTQLNPEPTNRGLYRL